MKNKSGVVLLAILLFMHVFTLMGLFALSASSDMLKISRNHWQRAMRLQQAQYMLFEVEKMTNREVPACLIPLSAPVLLAKENDLWWHSHGCHGIFLGMPYDYVVEVLDEDPCAIMLKNANNQALIARYYRITLNVPRDNTQEGRLIVQSTLAKPVMSQSSCSGVTHEVNIGRQMWREI